MTITRRNIIKPFHRVSTITKKLKLANKKLKTEHTKDACKLLGYMEKKDFVSFVMHIMSGSYLDGIYLTTGVTLLMETVKRFMYEYAVILVTHGCEIDRQSSNGATALMWACESGQVRIVKLLTRFNCNMDLQDEGGNTALIWALWYKHEEVAKLLIENRCDIDIKNRKGHTALFVAVEKEMFEIVCLLVKSGCNTNIQTMTGDTVLNYACRFDHGDTISLLLKCGCNPFTVNRGGYTALDYCDSYTRFYLMKKMNKIILKNRVMILWMRNLPVDAFIGPETFNWVSLPLDIVKEILKYLSFLTAKDF